MKLEIDVETLPSIPLRYYKGWTVAFNPKTETFESPLLCCYGFPSIKELENAMDHAIKRRG